MFEVESQPRAKILSLFSRMASDEPREGHNQNLLENTNLGIDWNYEIVKHSNDLDNEENVAEHFNQEKDFQTAHPSTVSPFVIQKPCKVSYPANDIPCINFIKISSLQSGRLSQSTNKPLKTV